MSEERGWKAARFHAGSTEIHRTLPHSIEAEQGVLSSMFQSADVIAKCDDRISTRFFYVPAHQTLFAKMVSVWRSGIPLDLITFTQILRDCNQLEEIGGASFITSIFTFVPSAENVDQYLEIVRDKYLLRQVIEACTQSVTRAFEDQGEVKELLSDVREKICSIEEHPQLRKRKTNRELVAQVIHNLDNPEKALGISTGLPGLDKVIGGMIEGANIVLAGETSCGKSSLAQLIANDCAVTRKIPTAIFTFEMNDEQTMQRIIQIRSEISAGKIARGEAEMFEANAFLNASEEIAGAPLHVISDRLDVAGIRSRCMQIRPRVCVIDYLQIIPEPQRKGESRTERFDRMSSEVKQMAMALGMTTITLSQLNDKETTYGSSMMTNDSDILLVIKSVGEPDEAKPIQDKVIKVAKQRDGGRPAIYLSFVKAITKFKERKK